MNKNIKVTVNDDKGKCIAFEFTVGNVTFSCRKMNVQETGNMWSVIPLCITEYGDVYKSILFEMRKDNEPLDKVYMSALYNINQCYNDIALKYLDIVDEARAILSGGGVNNGK